MKASLNLEDYKVIVLASDVHLGAEQCQAESFLEFLRNLLPLVRKCTGGEEFKPSEMLFLLVGDTFEIWREVNEVAVLGGLLTLKRGLTKRGYEGLNVVLLPGNHDYALRYILEGLPKEVGIGSRERWPETIVKGLRECAKEILERDEEGERRLNFRFLDGDYLTARWAGRRILITHGDGAEFHVAADLLRRRPFSLALLKWGIPEAKVRHEVYNFYHWITRQDEEMTKVYDVYAEQPFESIVRVVYDFVSSSWVRGLIGRGHAQLLAITGSVISLGLRLGQRVWEGLRPFISMLLRSFASSEEGRFLPRPWAREISKIWGVGRSPEKIVSNLDLCLRGTPEEGPWIRPVSGSEKISSTNEIDLIILGHFHLPRAVKVYNRILVDLGSWMRPHHPRRRGEEFNTFATLHSNRLTLWKYVGGTDARRLKEVNLVDLSVV